MSYHASKNVPRFKLLLQFLCQFEKKYTFAMKSKQMNIYQTQLNWTGETYFSQRSSDLPVQRPATTPLQLLKLEFVQMRRVKRIHINKYKSL